MTGGRTFLGARWVRALLALTPPARQPGLALWLLGLAPHYFRGRDRGGEAHRNRVSRELFVRDVLAPFLAPEQDLLDIGCGPGYLARAVAGRVWSVTAVDVSRGVLACARVLNPAVNIDYRTPREFFGSRRRVDIAVSLAVAEHLGDGELSAMLSSVRPTLRPGGRLLLRVAVADSDTSGEGVPPSAGPAPGLWGRYALRIHPRTRDHLVGLVERAGFSDVELHALGTLTDLDDGLAARHLLVATRPHDPVALRTALEFAQARPDSQVGMRVGVGSDARTGPDGVAAVLVDLEERRATA
ncbi:Methyltransferase type 12 [Parafrankia sp. Ea1.12]|uniref:class I SAM-dependent methyltransferase n=1 Tax=Parafrankia sp. Ea1.12 TaxID=573499 RepID=UPI000DA5010E|nr:class I SAM-dependent methyltransferase [Parafrankia sp. Ea1.12]SQD97019.1 Methyltransferase type 12 [Parafrankia sp. Ea1.12]